MRLKTEQFHHTDFFELLFDTAALIIQSLRMTRARGCKQRFKSDLIHVITWYLVGVGLKCNTNIQ